MSDLSIAMLWSCMRSCIHPSSQTLPAAISLPSCIISDIPNIRMPNNDTKRDANTTKMHTCNAVQPGRRYQCPQYRSLSPDGRPKLDMLYSPVSILTLQLPTHDPFRPTRQSLPYLIRCQISIKHKLRKCGIKLILLQILVHNPHWLSSSLGFLIANLQVGFLPPER